MSDGPRDASRWHQMKLFADNATVEPAKIGQTMYSVTQGEMARILDRYAKVPVGELKDEELQMILRFRAVVGG